MRVGNTKHPNHHLRQAILELRKRVKPGDNFRLEMKDGTPVLGQVLRYPTKNGVGTWIVYKVLKTGEEKTFSWMDPGEVAEVHHVDSNKDGMDFAGVAYQAAKKASKLAERAYSKEREGRLKEREDRLKGIGVIKKLTLVNGKQDILIKTLSKKLDEALGKEEAAKVIKKITAKIGLTK